MALVGCGAISPMHLYGLEQSGAPIDIVAAVDPDPERARATAEATGAAAFGSLDEARAGVELDAVDLMLPHHLHEEVAVQCFEAGLNVLLEKPLAPTLEACERILAAAAAAGTVFMVAENAQYWPEVLAVAAELEDGTIGEVVTARAATFFPPLPDFYGEPGAGNETGSAGSAGSAGSQGPAGAEPAERPWRFDQEVAGGGIAMDTGSHWLRPLHMWLGRSTETVAALGHPFPGMESESLVRSLIRFDSGVVASFDALLTAAPVAPEPLFKVTGTDGELTIDASGTVTRYRSGERRGQVVAEFDGYLGSYAGQFSDFAAAVLGGRSPAAGADAALGELRCALAMYRSAESGRWEPVWP